MWITDGVFPECRGTESCGKEHRAVRSNRTRVSRERVMAGSHFSGAGAARTRSRDGHDNLVHPSLRSRRRLGELIALCCQWRIPC